MEQKQIVSAEESYVFTEEMMTVMSAVADVYMQKQGMHDKPHITRHDFVSGYLQCHSELYPKLQSLTTERDEALKANDLLCKRIDQKDEELDLVTKANDGLRSAFNMESFKRGRAEREHAACEAERVRLAERLNKSSEAYGELLKLNKEYLEALKGPEMDEAIKQGLRQAITDFPGSTFNTIMECEAYYIKFWISKAIQNSQSKEQ
jgi:hypothetical protein